MNVGRVHGETEPRRTLLRAVNIHVRYRVKARRVRERSLRRIAPTMSVHAVRGVSIELNSGDALAVVGENGAGKSSLLAALAGLVLPSQGSVSFVVRPRLLGVGAVLHGGWTGRESIRVGLAALRVPTSKRTYVEREIAEFTELGDALNRPVQSYSRGMRSRLLFAINTAVPAGILLVDEALGGADGRFKARADERLERILSESGALVVTSHNRHILERLCTRAILLRQGRVVAQGTVDQVFDKYEP